MFTGDDGTQARPYSEIRILRDDTHVLLSWYSGDLQADPPWVLGMFDLTSIWLGPVDMSTLE